MLLVVLLIAAGGYSLMMIPKESSPTISFGIANVTTVYRGASPEDVDDLISEEIEKQLIDVD
jgi:multidrug efflux pump subunit AcrB